MIQLVGKKAVTATVPRQKINLPPAHIPTDEHVRWKPEGGVDLVLSRAPHLFHLVQAAAADDADCRNLVVHSRKLSALNPKDRQVEKLINLAVANAAQSCI